MSKNQSKRDFFKAMLRDRFPSAKAKIIGSVDNENMTGNVLFYKTPIGTIVSVEMYDITLDKKEYSFSIQCSTKYIDNKKGREERKKDCILQNVENDDGYIWLATLTSMIDVSEIVGHTMVIYKNEEKTNQKQIARGIVV